MDWDHMFLKLRRNVCGREVSGRRVHHPDRELVNSTGNFWALDSGANRALQETTGRAKFDLLRRWAAEGVHPVILSSSGRSPKRRSELHIKVDVLLDGTRRQKAMVEFRAVVETRALRLWDSAIERFPQVRRFAADHDMHADDPSPAAPCYTAHSSSRLRLRRWLENEARAPITLIGWTGRSGLEWVVDELGAEPTQGVRASQRTGGR